MHWKLLQLSGPYVYAQKKALQGKLPHKLSKGRASGKKHSVRLYPDKFLSPFPCACMLL
jgi:hypothetical protein